MKKALSIVLILLTVVGTCVYPVCAEEADAGIAPCMNNTSLVSLSFTIEDDGLAVMGYMVEGLSVMSVACVEAKLQKKTWGLFWTDVENGQNNNTWVNYFDNQSYMDEFLFHLTSKGTYRVVYKVTVNGEGGDPDVINHTIEDVYE